MFIYGYVPVHILQAYITGAGAIMRLCHDCHSASDAMLKDMSKCFIWCHKHWKFYHNKAKHTKNILCQFNPSKPSHAVDLALICSDNGGLHVRHQAIIWTNTGLLSMTQMNVIQWSFIWKSKQNEYFENNICKMAALTCYRRCIYPLWYIFLLQSYSKWWACRFIRF